MRDLDAFRRALAELRTADDWARFKARWFADQPWPRRSPEALAAATAGERTVTHGGRTFTRVALPDDVTP